MIDWVLASRIAGFVAGESKGAPLAVDGLAATAADAAARVAAYSRLEPAGPLPEPEAIDRPAWIAASQASVRPVMDPVTDRLGAGLGPLREPARAVGGALLAAEIGAVTGFLAQRVLGQYDVDLLEGARPPRLLLVAPNVAEGARKLDVDEQELLRWVTIHEVTHAVQFGGVPWLRDHLAGMLRELLEGLDVSVEPGALLRAPRMDDLRALVEAVRRGELVGLVVGPERRALLERIQSAMAVIEGHAEHVMDAVGAELLPSLDRLRDALDRRRTSGPVAMRVIARLIGLELKMRQYVQGRRFCDHVVAAAGPEGLARVWASPEALPSAAELDDPEAWLRRTAVRASG